MDRRPWTWGCGTAGPCPQGTERLRTPQPADPDGVCGATKTSKPKAVLTKLINIYGDEEHAMRKLLTVWIVLAAIVDAGAPALAQVSLMPGFPPGTFQNSAALDAGPASATF